MKKLKVSLLTKGSNQSDSPFHKTDKYGSNASQHSAGRHGTTKTHSADNQPDRIHHTAHTPCGNQVIQIRIPRLDLGTAIESHDQPFELRLHILNRQAGYFL